MLYCMKTSAGTKPYTQSGSRVSNLCYQTHVLCFPGNRMPTFSHCSYATHSVNSPGFLIGEPHLE